MASPRSCGRLSPPQSAFTCWSVCGPGSRFLMSTGGRRRRRLSPSAVLAGGRGSPRRRQSRHGFLGDARRRAVAVATRRRGTRARRRPHPATRGEHVPGAQAAINARLGGVHRCAVPRPVPGEHAAPSLLKPDDATDSGANFLVWLRARRRPCWTIGRSNSSSSSSSSSSLQPALGPSACGGAVRAPEHRRVEVAEQLSFALQAMHEEGVFHRDVKPENVLVDPSSKSLRSSTSARRGHPTGEEAG